MILTLWRAAKREGVNAEAAAKAARRRTKLIILQFSVVNYNDYWWNLHLQHCDSGFESVIMYVMTVSLFRAKYFSSVLGPKRLIYIFLNNIINLKGKCVLRTLKNSFAIF